MLRLDPSRADCFVFTYKEGLLSPLAHDLKIRVTRFEIDVDEGAPAVEGRFDANSLRVVCAMQDGFELRGKLSTEQKREIEGNIATEVLHANKYPEIRYVSTAVEKTGDVFHIAGDLSLHGRRRPVGVAVCKDHGRYTAAARVHQPDFGIRPYTALFGTLRVQANVDIKVIVPWPLRTVH